MKFIIVLTRLDSLGQTWSQAPARQVITTLPPSSSELTSIEASLVLKISNC